MVDLYPEMLNQQAPKLLEWIVETGRNHPPILIFNFRHFHQLTPQDLANLLQILNLTYEWYGRLYCCEMTAALRQQCQEWQVTTLLENYPTEAKALAAVDFHLAFEIK